MATSIEIAFRNILKNSVGVSAIAVGRIYPDKLPQGVTYPAVVYTIISGVSEHSHSGASGLAHPRIQVDCYATSYGECQALKEQVRLALIGFRGVVSGVRIQGIMFQNYDTSWTEDPGVFRRSMDFEVWHEEDTP